MVDGLESESLARLAATEADDEGRKTVFNSARVVIRLQPTPAYKPPIVTKMVRVEDGAPEVVWSPGSSASRSLPVGWS